MSVISRLCSRIPAVGQASSNRFSVSRYFRTNRSGGRSQGAERDPVGSPPFVDSTELPVVGFSALARPVLFGAVFSGGTFVGCTIWQYENMRDAARKAKMWNWGTISVGRKAGTLREELRQWWNSLPDHERLFIPICALNCLVFACWRVPALQPFMLKWFSANPGSRSSCWPMVLSAFSHYSLFHLGANMFVLHSFMGPAVVLLGQEQFLAVYLSSALVTSLASYAYKITTGRMGFSLGASGAICAVLGLFGTIVPDAKLQIVFLPMIQFTAAMAIKGMLCMDGAGMLLGWRFFDHAAHFSGILYGIFWVHFGNKLLWESREPVVQAWHKFRSS